MSRLILNILKKSFSALYLVFKTSDLIVRNTFLKITFHLLILTFIFLFASELSTAAEGEEDLPLYPHTGIGFSYHSCSADLSPSIIGESVNQSHPLYQRICVDRTAIEKSAGIYEWQELDSKINTFADSGYRIICHFIDSSIDKRFFKMLDDPGMESYTKGWLLFIKATSDRYKDKVAYFEIWDSPDVQFDNEELIKKYAYLLKSSSVHLKAEFRDISVIAGSISIQSTDWLKKMYLNEVATYIDVVILRYKNDEDIGSLYESMQKVNLEYNPSAKMWLMEEWGDTVPPSSRIIESIVASNEKESGLILFSSDHLALSDAKVKKAILAMHNLFSPSYSKSHEEAANIEFYSSEGEEIPVKYSKYFDPKTFKTIVAFYPEDDLKEVPDTLTIKIKKSGLKVARFFDVQEESLGKLYRFSPSEREDPNSPIVESEIPIKDYPVFIQYQEGIATPGFGEDVEQIGITGEKIISAEEIIARHQEFKNLQDSQLRHYLASAQTDFHFKMGGASGTVDVSTISNFYWEREEGAEWEQTEYFINGNRLNWKKIPELPLIQPEKVAVLPLDIHLDKSYKYRYIKSDRVGDRECYLLEFLPIEGFKKMYKGKVWIDQKTYAIVKLYTIQTDLEAPIISNEERNYYEPVKGIDGFHYWLNKRMEGQQIFSAGGRNFVVLREVSFSDFDINGDDFKKKQKTSHRSDHQILKDTDKGFRYFSKDKEGERFIKEDIDTNQIFAIGGAYKDNSFDSPIPLAGVNYFDYDFLGRGIQMNLFFAGILATLNITDADFLNSRFDFGLDFVGIGLKSEDKFFEKGTEIEEKNVENLSEYLGINLGYPLGNFFKVRGTLSLDYNSYSRADNTHPAFVIPSDHFTYGAGLISEYNQSGYGIQAGISYQKRSKWEAWGVMDEATGEFLEYDQKHKDFIKYSASASKEFFLPYFQKLRFEGEWMSGRDLDRFSKYRISYFVTRVRGFGGSGIRFERGAIARGQYSFNLFKIIRFDANVDYARVRDRLTFEEDFNMTGVGLSANFVGPWRTIIALDYGYGIRSDIEGIEGSSEFLFVVFKLF